MNRRSSECLSRSAAAAAAAAANDPTASSTTTAANLPLGIKPKKNKRGMKDISPQGKPQRPCRSSARSSRCCAEVINLFGLLDDNCRLKVLAYLTWQDLAEAAQTSRAFREDCRHPSLTQNADRRMVLIVRGRCGAFYRRLSAMVDSNRFATYTKLKVVRAARLEPTPDADAVLIRGGRTLPHVTSLELSFDPSGDTPELMRHRKQRPGIEGHLWKTVAEYLPHLAHLTVSHNEVAYLGPKVASYMCPDLDSLTWRNQVASTFLTGHDLDVSRLRCVDMDGSAFGQVGFCSTGRGITSLFEEDDGVCIFHRYVGELERVSLRNVTYYVYDRRNAKAIPQRGLIKFVRRAANLRWFRSDLTPENVAMLQAERPDVTFVS
jgi:hypothetical protein